MSRILKGIKRARCERGSVPNATVMSNFKAINPVDTILENLGSDQVLNRAFAIGIVLFTLASMALISASSQVTLNRTRQDIQMLSAQFDQQSQRLNRVNTSVTVEQLAALQERFSELEDNVQEGLSESSEAIITANRIRVDIDDLQMTENIFLERYIAMHNEISELKEKIKIEGRNL